MMKQENTPFGGWLKRKLLLICIKSKKVRTRTRRGIIVVFEKIFSLYLRMMM